MPTLAAERLRPAALSGAVVQALEQAVRHLDAHDKEAAQRALLRGTPEITFLKAVLERTEADFRTAQLAEIDRIFTLEAQQVVARERCAALAAHIATMAPGVAQLQAKVADLDSQVATLHRLTDAARDELFRVESTIEQMNKLRDALDVWWLRPLGQVLRGFGIIRSIPQIVSFLGDLTHKRATLTAAFASYNDQLAGKWTERDRQKAALAPDQALLAQLAAQQAELEGVIAALDQAAAGLRADIADIRKRLRFFTDVRLFYVRCHHMIEHEAKFVGQRIHAAAEILHDLDAAQSRTVDFHDPSGPFISQRQALGQFDEFLEKGLIPKA